MTRFMVLAILLCAIIAPPARAAETAAPATDAPAPTLDPAAVDHLIQTLEAPEKRQMLIDDLRTLATAQEEISKEAAPAPIMLPSFADSLGLRATFEHTSAAYHDFLTRNGLSRNVPGRILLTVLWLGIGWGALYLNRRLNKRLRGRLGRVRDRYRLSHQRFDTYARMLRRLISIMVIVSVLYAIAVIWNPPMLSAFGSAWLLNGFDALINIIIAIAVGIAVWEGISTWMDHRLTRATMAEEARLRTLLPLASKVIFVVLAAMLGFVILSELGINIVPLLAGAGVVGIAVGFGAQTIVKDFLSGFIFILENTVNVGDVVRVADRTGAVERVTINKIELRDFAGTKYYIPFSEVKIVENLTKDFSFFVLTLNFPHDVNMDKVTEVLRVIDADLRTHEAIAPSLLGPLEVIGVDAVTDTNVTYKARVKTKPSKQWDVGRAFYSRLLPALSDANITITAPTKIALVKTQAA